MDTSFSNINHSSSVFLWQTFNVSVWSVCRLIECTVRHRNGALKIFYFFPVLIHKQTFIFSQKQYIYHGCERQQSHASPHEQVLSHEHQNGSNTDVMIVHKTLTPLFCCKSMLLGYLLPHKVQIYAISKRPYSLLCAGPQGDYSRFSVVTPPVIYRTGKPV